MLYAEIRNAIKQNDELLAFQLVTKESDLLMAEIEMLTDLSIYFANSRSPDIKKYLLACQKKDELEKRGVELQRIIKKCDKKWGDKKWRK